MGRRRIGGIPLKWIAGGLGVLLLLSGFLLIRDGLEGASRNPTICD